MDSKWTADRIRTRASALGTVREATSGEATAGPDALEAVGDRRARRAPVAGAIGAGLAAYTSRPCSWRSTQTTHIGQGGFHG